MGFWFSHISFQDLMSDLTEDELWVSMLFVATFGPVLLIGPFGGVLVDRLDRKRVLMACYGAIVLTAGAQVALVAADAATPRRLLVTSFFVGTTMAILGPASQAITANVVPLADLPSAVSLQAMGSNLSRVVGPALAAPLIAVDLFEVTWSIYLAGAAFAAVAISGVALLPYARDTDTASVASRLMSGLRHTRERQPAFRSLTLVAVLSVFAVSHIALAPGFTRDALGREAGDFVWLGVATGLGALAGAFTAGSLRRAASLRRGALLAIPYAGLLVVFSLLSNFWVAVAVQMVMGFFYIASFTTLQVLLQQIVAEHVRGRVMSLFQISWAGLVPVGSLLMGLMAGDAVGDLGSATTIFITASIATTYAAWVAITSGNEPNADHYNG